MSASAVTPSSSYAARAPHCTNACGRALLELMARKQTNLSLAADVTTKAELIALADTIGPHICVLKTHIDILEDFDSDCAEQLTKLATKHDFMIFEDRKFADIGNTVKAQYAKGVYRIVEWAHIVNAHGVPGPGIIHGLRDEGLPKGRGLLMLAEMSSKGALAVGDYSAATIQMAMDNKDFVFGFVSQQGSSDPGMITFTPGVNMRAKGDALGQQYRTPETVVAAGTDVIIMGRGIYKAEDSVASAVAAREAGWVAYERRCKGSASA